MITCPSCEVENPDGFRFCGQCGTSLVTQLPIVEERKVVTTLFCDLVGSTALGEAVDTEDVGALLRRYSDLARRIIESHGGIVEKFIGDAVVGVFGVPAVHEDDPERAVRAGLRLVEAVEGLPPVAGHSVEVRIGINTGEALVRLDVNPGSGEGFLTGDAVNVGARLQNAAPPMGVVVGALTHELTKRAIVYEPLEAVVARGKSAPLEVWLAKQPVSRTGARTVDSATPFVGRAAKLAYLSALLDRAVDLSAPQLVLLVGESGIGKSRLVVELLARVDAADRLVTWRQAVCRPYGEEVTFSALADIVRVHAGIRSTDDRETVEARLEAVLPEGEDRAWFHQRLLALLGLEAPSADRDENFAAWLRFLEEIAARGPTVLVIEDLHWAAEPLLAFVEYFANNVTDVPLLLIVTVRPDLFERHPTFGSSGQVNRIALEPLSQSETVTLVSFLLQEIEDDVRRSIARHSEGNPFYAEESARLIRDAVHAAERSGTAPTGDIGLESGRGLLAGAIQGVIAARLDSLGSDLKSLLADASVVGTVFWDGGLAAVGKRSPQDVDAGLRELIARQLVHRVRESSMAGQREYAFAHALTCEVAYGELPRAERARKHAAVGRWLEAEAGDHPEHAAETIARHYSTALEAARAAGLMDLADSLVGPAVSSLALAGTRAINLDAAAGARHLQRALELAPIDSPDRPSLLLEWARALRVQGRSREAEKALTELLSVAEAAGDVRLAGRTMARLADVASILHDRNVRELVTRARTLLEHDAASPEKAEVLGAWAGYLYGCGGGDDPLAAVAVQEEAISMCDALGLPEPMEAIGMVAVTKCDLGDRGGLDDFTRAIKASEARGLGMELTRLYENYGYCLRSYQGPRAALGAHTTGLELARRRGLQASVMGLSVELVADRAALGEWDEALTAVADLVPLLDEAEDVWDLLQLRPLQTVLMVRRGRAVETAHFLESMTERGRKSEVTFIKSDVILAASAAYAALGDTHVALTLLADWIELPEAGRLRSTALMPEAVRVGVAAGDLSLAARLAGEIVTHEPLGEHASASAQALLAEARGEHEAGAAGFAEAAARWHEFGVPYEEAQALLGQGRCLMALGRAPEAAPVLHQAREIFERLGAAPALKETVQLLAKTSTPSGTR